MEFLTPVGQKVIKATAKEETATPGYLLVELANESMTDAKQCEILHQCLLKRAGYNDPVIKYKTFTVIKHLCLKGNPSLKRSFSQGAQVIKDALQYKGRPHPLRGDAPNQRVREAAKAALTALYSQAKQVKTRKMEGFGGGGSLASRGMGGSGSGSARGGGGSSSGIGGRRVSNGDYERRSSPGSSPAAGGREGTVMGPRTTNKYGRGIGSSGSMELGKKRPEDHIREGIQKAVKGIKSFSKEVEKAAIKTANDFNKAVGLPPAKLGGDYGFASNRGSNAVGSEAYRAPAVDRTVNQATSDGSFERSIISDLVAPTGMNNAPDMEKLARFLKRCETLSANVVGPILEDKMRHGEFKVKCKALVTVHAILEMDHLTKFHRYFKAHTSVIEELCGDKATVAKKAQRVMETLSELQVGPEEGPTVDEDGGGGGGGDDGGFDFEGGDGGGGGDDMFADMGGGDGGDDMFADMEADGGGDMFAGMDGVDDNAGGGGFDFDEAPAPAVVAAPTPAAAAADDFFGGSATPAPAPAPAAGMDDLIGNLDFGAPAPAGGGMGMSALDGMGGGGGMGMGGNGGMANHGGGASTRGGGMGDLDFMSSSAPGPAPAPAASGGGGNDMFGDMMGGAAPSPAPAPAPAANDDPFAGLM